MIHANDIYMTIGSKRGQIAATTAVNVEINQALKEYTPIAGSAEDDGWRHYRPGKRTWSLESDALLTDDMTYVKALVNDKPKEQYVNIFIPDGARGHYISGKAFIKSVDIQAAVRSLVKFTAKFATIEFPFATI